MAFPSFYCLRLQLGSFAILLLVAIASAQLSTKFYKHSCPGVFTTIKSAVNSAVASEARMGASLLRLHFHDCFVNGCDASVLLSDNATFTGEKTAPPNNNSLRGFNIIDSIKASLETSCPGVVSCADILAIVARDAVVALGGPKWKVPLGRRDSVTANFSAVVPNLISPTASLSELISGFDRKGFSEKELVALYGAHTIGKAKCSNFRTRIYNETDIDPSFATSLQAVCPFSGGDDNLSNFDVTSPDTFDNGYYNSLLGKKGLLHSDQQLFSGGSTNAQVSKYAAKSGKFRKDFAKAMVKMGNLDPLTGTMGEIRKICSKAN